MNYNYKYNINEVITTLTGKIKIIKQSYAGKLHWMYLEDYMKQEEDNK